MASSSHLLRSRARVAAITLALVLAAACSSGGSTGSSASTDSTGGARPTSSDSGEASATSVTEADLEELLPSASQVGAGYTEQTSSSDSDSGADSGGSSDSAESPDSGVSSDSSESDESFEKAAEEQCPGFSKLMTAPTSDGQEEARRTYTSETAGSIEVGLRLKTEPETEADLDEKIKAFNDCGTLTTTVNGEDATMSFSAERNDALGDLGVVIRLTVEVGFTELNTTLTFRMAGYAYRVGDVDVEVTAMSDLDPQTFAPVGPDEATAKRVAEELEPKVQELAGG